ncbi:MAG: aspartate aminotransferase family protein [Paludibacterium sp.]|uniref:pyridoxal phosphate-dependent decarboxylase family protein n=1 Tax=Paludibacterium sp. TaxID=1917523 RepID=UPI0025EDF56F|nr:pyridoxal-dependent decarboxylase [Paludibacterium sp.]MBV8046091.1 aspartate aminotransferase family protein [Paludibacterium sp.]MBV8647424.1 aspartate aminotransferase family protein [Paludibacterium sp.]
MDALLQDQQALFALQEDIMAWSASWLRQLDARPVAHPGDPLPPPRPLPTTGLGLPAVWQAFKQDLAPGFNAAPGPRYLGFVTGGVTPASLAGDWLTAVLDQNVASTGNSIATGVELQVLDWLCQLLDLPSSLAGSLTTGATAANLLGMVCARQHAGWRQGRDVARDGLGGVAIEVFSATPHASSLKVLGLVGLGREQVVAVPCLPDSEAMDVAALGSLLAGSSAPGKIVIASAGTVTGTDFDDLAAIAALCRAHHAWLHVDGAFGLFSRLDPSRREWTAGIEQADSITCDAHKWLNVPYDCGIFLTRHAEVLQQCCSVSAPYLDQDDALPALMDRGIEQSRRFRALPLWFNLLAYGRGGVRQWVEANCDQAARLAAWLEASADFELLKTPKLNVVVFRPVRGEAQALLQQLNAGGEVFMTPGQWRGKAGIRAAFSNWRTTDADVERVCRALARVAGA